MKEALEAVCRRFARRIRQNGVLMLTHDGDPALAAAFAALGWDDAHPEIAAPVVAPAASENTTLRDSEQAVMPGSEGHQR